MTDHQFGQNQNTAFERCQTPETGHLKPFITVKSRPYGIQGVKQRGAMP
jgi:hypothetical protein